MMEDPLALVLPEEFHSLAVFQGVEKNVLEYLAKRSKREFTDRETMLAKQDSLENKVYLIKRGVCQLLHKDILGVERHKGFRYTGYQIGLAGVLARRQRYATIMTLTRCETLLVDRDAFITALLFSQRLMENSYLEIADRFHALMETQQWGLSASRLMLKEGEVRSSRKQGGESRIPQKEVVQKLAAFLVEWEHTRLANNERLNSSAEHLAYRLVFDLYLPEAILAQRLNVEETELSRAMSYLDRENYIQRGEGRSKPIISIEVGRIQEKLCAGLTFSGGKDLGR